MTEIVSCLANISAILTAAVAVLWFAHDNCDKRNKQAKLEQYLDEKWRAYKAATNSKLLYRHSIIHLVAELGLTEDEVLQASFRSNKIRRKLMEDDKGIAKGILLEHIDSPEEDYGP